jgi:hypothetical protein
LLLSVSIDNAEMTKRIHTTGTSESV